MQTRPSGAPTHDGPNVSNRDTQSTDAGRRMTEAEERLLSACLAGTSTPELVANVMLERVLADQQLSDAYVSSLVTLSFAQRAREAAWERISSRLNSTAPSSEPKERRGSEALARAIGIIYDAFAKEADARVAAIDARVDRVSAPAAVGSVSLFNEREIAEQDELEARARRNFEDQPPLAPPTAFRP